MDNQAPEPQSETPAQKPRKNRARERYERRRKRRQNDPGENESITPLNSTAEAALSSTEVIDPEERSRRREARRSRYRQQATRPNRLQQVIPADTLKLPDLNWPLLRTVGSVIAGTAFVVLIVFILGLFKDDPADLPPNAIWVADNWTYENADQGSISLFADQLRENEIGTVFAWVSTLKEDGTWAGPGGELDNFVTVEANVRSFAEQFKDAYPDANLYGWIGFRADIGPDSYRLDDSELQQRIADFSLRVIEDLGFDGVLINVEPVWNENADDYLDLLRQIQRVVGDTAPVAVAVPPDWSPSSGDVPVSSLIAPGTEWDVEFKQRVALLADLITIRTYNSGLSSPVEYAEWVAYQTQTYAEAIAALDTGARILVGIPTYDNEPPFHEVTVENVTSALNGVQRGLDRSGDAAEFVQGVALFAEWAIDAQEWTQFERWWSGR